jgi:hypothetical protein
MPRCNVLPDHFPVTPAQVPPNCANESEDASLVDAIDRVCCQKVWSVWRNFLWGSCCFFQSSEKSAWRRHQNSIESSQALMQLLGWLWTGTVGNDNSQANLVTSSITFHLKKNMDCNHFVCSTL